MAPEQFQGRAAPGSDVYAVGATALCLLSGREPEDLPHKGLAIDVDGALRGQVDRRLIGALTSMLEPDPDRRPSSVAEALRRYGFDTKPGNAKTRDAKQPPPSDAKQSRRDWKEPSQGARPSLNDAINDVVSGTVAEAAKRARRARIAAEDELFRAREELAAPFLREGERQRARAERHAQKQVRKALRREARRQERNARRYGSHRPGPAVIPGRVLGVFVLLALRLASVGVFVLFQLLLPILFTLLGRANRRSRMLAIGHTGQLGLERAGQHIRYQLLGGPEPRLGPPHEPDDVDIDVQGRSEAGPRVRVQPSANATDRDMQAALEEVEAELAGSTPTQHKAKSG
jgi:hypothetical protein